MAVRSRTPRSGNQEVILIGYMWRQVCQSHPLVGAKSVGHGRWVWHGCGRAP